MRKVAQMTVMTALLAVGGAAQAMLVDFKAIADGAYGESAWNPFSLSLDFGIDVDIIGVKTTDADGVAYAYLDSRAAGMGVCGDLSSGTPNTKNPSSTSNLCDPSSDDNVTAGEMLKFVFNEDVIIDKLWFNNNHDVDESLHGDTITIFGDDYTFSAADDDLGRVSGTLADVVYNGPLAFSSGDEAYISFFIGGDECRDREKYPDAVCGDQFYLSALKIRRNVPEPMTLGLLAFGLIGLGLSKRRVRSS